jgi:hypothetical protein
MSPAEIAIFAVVIILGVPLYWYFRQQGHYVKARLEAEALERVDRILSRLDGKESGYRVLTKHPGSKGEWKPSSLSDMRREVVSDCVRGIAEGPTYGKSRHAIWVDIEHKVIYYVVGVSSYDFKSEGLQNS